MLAIVQLTHPGGEHGSDRGNKTHKSWNLGKHQRKFLNATGFFVQENSLKEENLMFWGEWEPPSTVRPLDSKENKFMPNWLHKPYLPGTLPLSTDDQNQYQNTDPLVFGNSFRYFVCKQFKPKRKRETSLAKLDKGSVILFGSTGNQNTEEAFFQLDTVFVVSDYIEYDPSDINALSKDEKDNFRDVVYKMAFKNPLDYSLKLRLYRGATYNNPVSGMYSYTPAKIYENNHSGFARISLKDLDYITNNLNAAPKISKVELGEIIKFWETIREISRKQGCVEGVKFSMPKKIN